MRDGARAHQREEPLVEGDEDSEEQEPGAHRDGEDDREQGHRAGECEQDAGEREPCAAHRTDPPTSSASAN